MGRYSLLSSFNISRTINNVSSLVLVLPTTVLLVFLFSMSIGTLSNTYETLNAPDLQQVWFDYSAYGSSSQSIASIPQTIDIQKAKQFIKNQYDPSVKLVKESPALDRFWLWTDNVLAVKVLSGFDNQLAQSINQTVNQAKSQYKLEMRHPIAELVDRPQDFSVKPSTELQISTNPDVRYSDYASGETDLACGEYGDIAFLSSIHLFREGRTTEAKTCYDLGAAQFDGIGVNDRPRQISAGAYDTFKMILWKIAQNITGFTSNGPPQPYTDNLIANAQDSDGGIMAEHTTIDPILGLTNVETTALAIMAYNNTKD
jgi:hypothetical protein